VFVMLPGGDREFDSQSEQIAEPNPALYWLILHCEHKFPFPPVYPALHSHAVLMMLAGREIEEEGQFVQVGPNPAL